ncbi:MAG: glycosyltransferase family 4 protein [Terriglobales bacterium]
MSEFPGRLRVLQVQNQHAPGWGGEETVVALEKRLLQDHGHVVEDFQVSNARLKSAHIFWQILAVPSFLWSRRSYAALRRRIAEFEPDVVHVHNTFPELSPSVFWAARREGVPVVQTLHNFRHVCANALLLRDGFRCEKCVGRRGGSALLHRCYARSLSRSAVVVATGILHQVIGTYSRGVDAFITLNDFNREIFRGGGLPDNKLHVKPNFVPASQLGNCARKRQAIFVGAMMPSKGVHLLLQAWSAAALAEFELLLIGDGPERKSLEREFAHLGNITWCGRMERPQILARMAESRVLVFPSLAYENCPMVVLEALSVGTPVVSANHSSLTAMVEHQREGLLFQTGDAQALASALREALHADDGTWSQWSSAARQTHAQRYSDNVNYQQLVSIYGNVMRPRAAR